MTKPISSGSIWFLDTDPEDRAAVEKRFPEANIEGHLSSDEIMKRCVDAKVISAFIQTPFQKETLQQLPHLKLLCTRSVGYDHIDLAACEERGIIVCNVPDYGSHVIAEHVFALLLGTLRHIHEGDRRMEAGEFDYRGLRGISLRGKTLGILGTGKIGRRVAEIALGFGMKILAVDVCRTLELEDWGVRYTDLKGLLLQSDIITLHLPDTKETHHMIDTAAFKAMKDGVILVNTARGGLIDSAALVSALKSGKVAHALLDVLEHEGNFQENKELIGLSNVVTTPHIAFYADDSMRNMYQDAFDSIDQWAAGKEPDHRVQPVRVVCDLPGVRL